MKKILFFVLIIFSQCNNINKTNIDTMKEGTINISVDEAFKPVMIEQINVFQSQFPKAKINVQYKSEIDCFNDLKNDSTRLVIVSRPLNMEEFDEYKKYLKYSPRYDLIAYSAILVLHNKENNDSIFNFQQLQEILSGKINKQIVVDGKNLTSTVRFLRDSILKGAKFGKNILAAENSTEVLNIISKNKNSIGFVGLNWLNDRDNLQHATYFKNIDYIAIECYYCSEKGIYVRPSQKTIAEGYYPLTIPVYYILKENHSGLGSTFINFLTLESGQLIFKKALFLPTKINFYKRTTKLS